METPGLVEVRSKVWIERREVVLLSEWRISLLEAIASEGSLTRAAALLEVPFRTVWERVRQMETQLGLPLVLTESGGSTGGSSRITPEAEDLVARFRRLTVDIRELIERRFEVEFRGIL